MRASKSARSVCPRLIASSCTAPLVAKDAGPGRLVSGCPQKGPEGRWPTFPVSGEVGAMAFHGDLRVRLGYDWFMALIEETRSRVRATPTLTLVTARNPRGFGWLNFMRRSLRAQTVLFFVLLVAFAVIATVVAQDESVAVGAAQAEQVGLITWRYDSLSAIESALELRTNLTLMNDAQLP